MLFSGLRGQQTTRAGRLKTRSKSLRQQVRRRPSSIQCDAQLEFSELREHRERAGPIFMTDRCCFLTRSSAGSCDLKRLANADDDTCNSQFTNETACTTGSQGGAPCHWCKSAAVLSSSPGASRAWITHADTATRLGCTFSQSHHHSMFPWQGTGCVERSFSGCGGGEQSLRRKHAHHRYPRHVTTTRIMLGCHPGSSRAPSSRSPSARFSIHIRRPSRGRVNFKPPCTSPRPTPRRQALTSGTVTVTVAAASC